MPAMIDTPPLATPRLTSNRGAELERGFQDAHALGVIVTPKNPPPAKSDTESRNGFSRVQKLNCVSMRLVDERHLEVRAEDDVRRARTRPTARFGDREVEAGLDALGGHVEVRRVAEAVERDDAPSAC